MIFYAPHDDGQGALCFAPVYLSVCPSVRPTHLKSLCNQLLLECSSNQFETFHECYQPIEDVHVIFEDENIYFDKITAFLLRQF